MVTLVIGGGTTAQIAATLGVSEKTVEAHRRHVYEKLDGHSQAQLLARFFRECYLPSLWPSPARACDGSWRLGSAILSATSARPRHPACSRNTR